MKTINLSGNVIPDEYAMMYAWFGMPAISPQGVNQQLNDANGDDVTINLSSNGGDVFSGSQIYTALKSYAGNVKINVTGLAASAASVIAMAGDNLQMSPTAQLMIHKAWSDVAGNADDHDHESQVLDKIDNSIVNAYVDKTGMDRADIMKMMSTETWMTAKEAVDKGFADGIMFVDETTPVFTDTLGSLPSKGSLNSFMNWMNKQKQAAQNSVQPVKNKAKPTPSLKDQKLAILFGRKDDENANN